MRIAATQVSSRYLTMTDETKIAIDVWLPGESSQPTPVIPATNAIFPICQFAVFDCSVAVRLAADIVFDSQGQPNSNLNFRDGHRPLSGAHAVTQTGNLPRPEISKPHPIASNQLIDRKISFVL